MKIFLFLALLWGGALWAEELPQKGTAELYADSFRSEGDIVYATGNVVLSYDDTLFLGEKARYDRKHNVIVVTGNVEILGNRGNKVLSDRVVFEVGKHRVTFRDFYHTDREDIWIYAQEAQKQDGNYTMRNSILSSCHPDDPDWSVKFARAEYDADTKYMKLHDVKFYAKKLPVFYTPYLGFSLRRQRSSGLLMPHFGLKKDEGLIYEQPYFWAISEDMDLELNPQIRTKRGYGLYGTFRFVDGPDSHGQIRAGYFRDRTSYTEAFNLKNSDHYGAELFYESSDVLGRWRPQGYRDGLYADIDLFNDIDYLNLQYNALGHLEETSRFKESRVNYFLYNDEQYFGIGGRYFIDTSSLENNETIQELPALQYHKFSAPLIDDLIHYSIDARLTNYYRKEGVQAYRGEIRLPLLFHTAFFDDFLNLAVGEEFSAADTHFSDTKIWHGGALSKEDHYAAAVLHHSIELSSDLTRSYAGGVHTMLLKAALTKSTLLAEGDLKYDAIRQELRNDYDLDMIYDTRLAFSMHHFWESFDGNFDADYLAVADYYPDNDSKWNKLRQELHLKYGNFTFSSRIDYSIRDSSFTQLSNTLGYSNGSYGFSLHQTRLENELDQTLDTDELGLEAHYRQNEQMTWFGGYTYDFKEHGTKDWKAGFALDRKCWNISIVFEQDLTPVLKENGGSSIRNNTIYFRFNLVPFGGIGSSGKTAI